MDTVPSDNLTESALTQLKLADLKAQCKEKQLPVSGTKAELIARLLGTAPPTKKPRVAKASAASKPALPDKPVFQTLMQSSARDQIIIKRNAYGHFEHLETRLVFSPQKKVIGRHVDNQPDVQPLTTTDLEAVYKYHFELAEGVTVQDQPSLTADTIDRSEERLEELLQMIVPGAPPKLYRQRATMDVTEPDDEDDTLE